MESEREREYIKLDQELARFTAIVKPTKTDLAKIQRTLDRLDAMNAEDVGSRAAAGLADLRAPVGNGNPVTGGYANVPGHGTDYRKFGEFLQCVYAAAPGVDAGRKVGRFETGRVYRDVLFGAEERAPAGMSESTPSLGGFAVGSDQADEIFQKAYQRSVLWSRCREFPISSDSNSVRIPGVDESSRQDGSRQGGILSYWAAEAAEKTASTPKLNAVELSLKKLIGLCYSTDELLMDASLLGEFIANAFEREFAFELDNAVLRGTGVGQPLGILNAASLVSVSGASSANTIVAGDVLGCYARLWPGSEDDSFWIANRDTLPQLLIMNTSADGTGSPFWMPMNSMAGRPHNTLLGRPIYFVEQCSTLGDQGDLMLIDLTQYCIGTKGGLQAATSIHVKFSTDETCFRFVLRVDGQPLWSSAVTPFQGTDTQSPFITIGTRT